MISCLVPTIPGREEWLERCVASIHATCTGEMAASAYEVVVEREGGNWGEAINIAAGKAAGDYFWLGSDDMELCPGWHSTAVTSVENGELPAPLVLNGDGSIQSAGTYAPNIQQDGEATEFPRVPFCSREQWDRIGGLLPIHFADVRFGTKAAALGIPTVVRTGYRLVHYMVDEGRRDYRTEEAVRLSAEKGESLLPPDGEGPGQGSDEVPHFERKPQSAR